MTKKEFKLVYDKHYDAIRSYIYYRCGDQDLANDIAQETFLKIWEKDLDSDHVVGLLYKIAKDLFVSRHRRQKLETGYLNSIKIHFNYHTPEQEYQFQELETRYEAALGEMIENQRVVFLMSRLEHLKYAEIAKRLDLSVKAIEKRMKGALTHLKQKLGNNG